MRRNISENEVQRSRFDRRTKLHNFLNFFDLFHRILAFGPIPDPVEGGFAGFPDFFGFRCNFNTLYLED